MCNWSLLLVFSFRVTFECLLLLCSCWSSRRLSLRLNSSAISVAQLAIASTSFLSQITHFARNLRCVYMCWVGRVLAMNDVEVAVKVVLPSPGYLWPSTSFDDRRCHPGWRRLCAFDSWTTYAKFSCSMLSLLFHYRSPDNRRVIADNVPFKAFKLAFRGADTQSVKCGNMAAVGFTVHRFTFSLIRQHLLWLRDGCWGFPSFLGRDFFSRKWLAELQHLVDDANQISDVTKLEHFAPSAAIIHI